MSRSTELTRSLTCPDSVPSGVEQQALKHFGSKFFWIFSLFSLHILSLLIPYLSLSSASALFKQSFLERGFRDYTPKSFPSLSWISALKKGCSFKVTMPQGFRPLQAFPRWDWFERRKQILIWKFSLHICQWTIFLFAFRKHCL